MTEGHNGHKWISHFVCQWTHYHWVWTHRDKGEATHIITLIVNLTENHYEYHISFIRTNGEPALGRTFTALLTNHGIKHEETPYYTPEPNGQIERSGGVITQKARCISISANLPENLWPETISAAAYILNRTPTSKTGKTLFEALYGFKPTISHMKIYGCKAYPLIYNIPRLQKLKPRAHIGYLVGYSSRNIYRVWVPSRKDVIRIRDVSFDQTAFYQMDDVDVGQLVQAQEFQHAFRALQEIPESLLAHNQDEDELTVPSNDTVYDGNTAENTTSEALPKTPPTENQQFFTPPPSALHNNTVATSSTSSTSSASETLARRRPGWDYRPADEAPSRSDEVSVNMDENLILPNQARNRRQAYATALTNLDSMSGYHAAFASEYKAAMDHLHRDKLPKEPKYWKQMLKHPHGQYFMQAAIKEFDHLKQRGTFKLTSKSSTKSTVLPLVWIFKYKFDDEGYLVKHKARLYVRGDLQKTEQDTAAATLAIRVFRALMALTASFKLTAK